MDFLDQTHPITNVINPATSQRAVEWTVSEEWYNFTTSPRGKVHVLAHLNAAIVSANVEEPDRPGVTGTTHGNDHPIMWCQEFDGGRSVYLGPGHANATFSDPIFRGLMVSAIEWAAGLLQGDSKATIDANYEKVVLDPAVSNPMSIDIDSTGKVYLVERKGAVKVHDQATGQTRVIGNLSAHSDGEYGLLGITLAPDFNTSRQLYILWSPATGNNNRLSRFTLNGAGDLNLASEVSIIEYLTNRSAGHHQSGSVAFTPDGNVVMSLGDNTWASQFSPRNDTSIANDACKGSPKSNDLRGGIVRIRPNVGGGPPAHPNYTIPSGNLFPPGTPLGRPEVYTKGSRNCFRLCVDPYTGWVYYGDVGPDRSGLSSDLPFEGSLGHDDHQHNELQLSSLTGSVTVSRDDSHGFDEDLGYVFDVFYTDLGAPSVQPIQGNSKIVLQPKVTQAQTRDGQSGTATTPTSDPVGGKEDVTGIDHGDHIFFGGLNLTGIQSIHFRAFVQGLGGNIEIRNGSPTGSLIGTVAMTVLNTVRLDFNQIMDLGGLENMANYAIDKGATITSVAPLPDQSGVVLTFSGLSQADCHALDLTGLMDLAGDGIANFLTQQPGAHFNAASDIDQDTLSALLEYALGGSETTQDAVMLPHLAKSPTGAPEFAFNHPAGLPDVSYSLQGSDDLTTWVPLNPPTPRPRSGVALSHSRFTNLIPAAQAAGVDVEPATFYRLVVSLTPVTP